MNGQRSQRKGKHIWKRPIYHNAFPVRFLLVCKEYEHKLRTRAESQARSRSQAGLQAVLEGWKVSWYSRIPRLSSHVDPRSWRGGKHKMQSPKSHIQEMSLSTVLTQLKRGQEDWRRTQKTPRLKCDGGNEQKLHI